MTAKTASPVNQLWFANRTLAPVFTTIPLSSLSPEPEFSREVTHPQLPYINSEQSARQQIDARVG